MGRIVTCGICGFMFEEGDPTEELRHKVAHQEHGKDRLELPQAVRDMIRFWADQKLRAATSGMLGKELQEVDTARWVMMHMWYNAETLPRPARDIAFKAYEVDIKKRYPNTRDLLSNFVGV